MNEVQSVFEWLDSRPFTRFHKRLVLLGSLVCIGAGYNSQIIAYILPFAFKEWHLTPIKAGSMISYGFLGLMVGAIGFGMVSDRIGRKMAIMLVVAVSSIFGGAAFLAPNFEVFCLFRFLCGLGVGGVIPLTITLVSEFAPSALRARILSFVGGTFTIGWALAGLFAMLFVPFFGWRAMLLIGLIPVFLLPVLFIYLPESVRFLGSKGRYDEALREIRGIEKIAGLEPAPWKMESFFQPAIHVNAGFSVLFHPEFRTMTILVWGTYLFAMLALYGLSTWLPSLLANEGFSIVKSFSYGMVQSLGAFVGGFLLGCFMDVFGRKPGLCFCFFIGSLSVLLFGWVTSALSLYLVGAATGIFLVGIPSALHVVANEIYPTSIRSTGAGWAYAVGRIGSIAGPLIGGIVQTAGFTFTQFFLLFSLPSFLCVILVALYPVAVKKEGLEQVQDKLSRR
jgi:benzoate transport